LEFKTDYIKEVKSEYQLEFSWLLQDSFPFEEALIYEEKLKKFFEKSNVFKSEYVYFLIDARVEMEIPQNAAREYKRCQLGIKPASPSKFRNEKCLALFISSIFYIGIGKSTNNNYYRPMQHFFEAYKSINDPEENPDYKLETIKAIWSRDRAPLILVPFANLSVDEAQAREAILIDVLRSNLTNQNRGSYKVCLNMQQRNLLGVYFVYRAFLEYLNKGGRRIGYNQMQFELKSQGNDRKRPLSPDIGVSNEDDIKEEIDEISSNLNLSSISID